MLENSKEHFFKRRQNKGWNVFTQTVTISYDTTNSPRESGQMLGRQEWSRTPRKNECKDKGFHLIKSL